MVVGSFSMLLEMVISKPLPRILMQESTCRSLPKVVANR